MKSPTKHTAIVVFHAKRDRATKANTHLAHLQAQTHMLTLQLAKEPNFSRRTTKIETKVTVEILIGFFKGTR